MNSPLASPHGLPLFGVLISLMSLECWVHYFAIVLSTHEYCLMLQHANYLYVESSKLAPRVRNTRTCTLAF